MEGLRTGSGSVLADSLSALREDEAVGRANRHHALLAPSANGDGFVLPDTLAEKTLAIR